MTPDFYTLDLLALKAGVTEDQASELLAKGAFAPTEKNGRMFYSSRQVHQLLAALRISRKHCVSFEEALQMMSGRVSPPR